MHQEVILENGFVKCDYVKPNCWPCSRIDPFIVHHRSDALSWSRFSWTMFAICHWQLERRQRSVRCEMAIHVLLQFRHSDWILSVFHIEHRNLQVSCARRRATLKTMLLYFVLSKSPQDYSVDAQKVGGIIFGTIFGCSVRHYIMFDDLCGSYYDNIGLH